MIFVDRTGLGKQISLQLSGAQQSVIEVVPGRSYRRLGQNEYTLRPHAKEDYEALVAELAKTGQSPSRVIHLWSIKATPVLENAIQDVVSSILYLAQAFSRRQKKLDIAIISDRLLSVSGEPVAFAFGAALLGLLEAMRKELPEITWRSIDVDRLHCGDGYTAVQIISEHAAAFNQPVVAYRGEERWVQRTEYARFSAVEGVLQPKWSCASPREIKPNDLRVEEPDRQSKVESVLVEWWKELLGIDKVSVDDDFFDLGGDSIIATHLFSRIKKSYNLSLSLVTIFEARTIRKLSHAIRRSAQHSDSVAKNVTCVAPIQPKGNRTPIYVISGLLGNVIKFHSLAFYLGEDQPMYGLLPRGLDGKEPYLTTVEEMAAYYVRQIRQVQPEGPYHLLGYSFGGIVAFEVAQQIVAQGGCVGVLAMLDTIEWRYLEKLQKASRTIKRYTAYKEHLEVLLSGENRFRDLKNLLITKSSKIIYRFFRAIGRPIPQHVGTIGDINILAARSYEPKNYPGKLTLFRSTLRQSSEEKEEELGWKGLANEIEVFHVPSDHFNILKVPSVHILAQNLQGLLDHDHVQIETSSAAAK